MIDFDSSVLSTSWCSVTVTSEVVSGSSGLFFFFFFFLPPSAAAFLRSSFCRRLKSRITSVFSSGSSVGGGEFGFSLPTRLTVAVIGTGAESKPDGDVTTQHHTPLPVSSNTWKNGVDTLKSETLSAPDGSSCCVSSSSSPSSGSMNLVSAPKAWPVAWAAVTAAGSLTTALATVLATVFGRAPLDTVDHCSSPCDRGALSSSSSLRGEGGVGSGGGDVSGIAGGCQIFRNRGRRSPGCSLPT